MRIVQLGLDWFPESAGGVARYYYDLLNAQVALGAEVRGIVAGSDAVRTSSNGMVTAFAPLDSPMPQRLASVRRELRHAVTEFRPDVIAAHFALYAFPALLAMRGTPLVAHFHGPWASESEAEGRGRLEVRMKRAVERAVYHRAARFIVLSKAFGDILVSEYGVPEAKLDLVPGATDTARFATPLSRLEAREQLDLPTDRPILLTVRRLVNRMGIERLIDAIGIVRQHVPEVLLLIGGKGPLAAALQAAIDQRGLSHHIRLLGYVADDELPMLYRSADASVVPTQTLEGFGIITVESLAAGTPVFVTPVGGLPESVSGLSADLVLPGTQAAQIAEGLTRFLRGGIRVPSDVECRRYAADHFDWKVIAPRVLASYERAMSAEVAAALPASA